MLRRVRTEIDLFHLLVFFIAHTKLVIFYLYASIPCVLASRIYVQIVQKKKKKKYQFLTQKGKEKNTSFSSHNGNITQITQGNTPSINMNDKNYHQLVTSHQSRIETSSPLKIDIKIDTPKLTTKKKDDTQACPPNKEMTILTT